MNRIRLWIYTSKLYQKSEKNILTFPFKKWYFSLSQLLFELQSWIGVLLESSQASHSFSRAYQELLIRACSPELAGAVRSCPELPNLINICFTKVFKGFAIEILVLLRYFKVLASEIFVLLRYFKVLASYILVLLRYFKVLAWEILVLLRYLMVLAWEMLVLLRYLKVRHIEKPTKPTKTN